MTTGWFHPGGKTTCNNNNHVINTEHTLGVSYSVVAKCTVFPISSHKLCKSVATASNLSVHNTQMQSYCNHRQCVLAEWRQVYICFEISVLVYLVTRVVCVVCLLTQYTNNDMCMV